MPQSKPCACCKTDCQWIKKKVKTRLSWVLVMVLLGTCDVFINWVNYADLTSPELHRGLVLGPPPRYMQILLLTFTIIGSVLYIPETLNTFSVFFYEGATKVPIIYEQLIILPVEQIPLAAINYFISRCRKQYGSIIQTLCGTTSIVYVFIRIVWYAHMEGKLLQRKDDVKMKKGLFMAICALYACSMAFPIMNWRSKPDQTLLVDEQNPVSIFLLNAPLLQRGNFRDYVLDLVLEGQGRDMYNPMLAETLEDVVRAQEAGIIAAYRCDSNATILPAECLSTTDGYLVFRLIYAPYTEAGPYGEIVYNYAVMHPLTVNDAMANSKNFTQCSPSKGPLSYGWRLFYLNYVFKDHNGVRHHFVSSPWQKTCTTPEPWYDASIPVCPKSGYLPRIHLPKRVPDLIRHHYMNSTYILAKTLDSLDSS